MFREQLRLCADPLDLLTSLRGRAGLVGLVGAWAGGGALITYGPTQVVPPESDPFAMLAVQADDASAAAGSVGGGWFGFWGYPVSRRLERLPEPPSRPLPQADHWVARYEWVLRHDRRHWWFESLLPDRSAGERLRAVLGHLEDRPAQAQPYRFEPFTMTPTPEQHLAAIARAIDHIRAGDIFQANICARLEAGFEGDPLDVFCSGVRHLSPAYAAFMDTGERAVVSLSPELFLRRSRRTVLTSPIKGTAALNTDPREFAASAKDRAENVMIVDLMRNDLGRVCEPGSIGVPVLARPDDRVGVRHLVSDVTGTLRDQLTDADLLRACFPPGSVTGAPKVRAMEIINELEATGREVYTGAIGYASPVGGLESNVAIRTFEFAGDRCWLGVGGGVVADSNPRAELAECFTKAVPLLTAIDARLSDTLRDRIARPDTPSGTGEHRLALTVDGARPDPAQGVFTTMLVHDGSPVRGEAHLKRLRGSAAALGFDTSIQHLAGAVRGRPALPGTQRVRIEVTADGVDVRTTDAPAEPGPSWRLIPVGVPGGLGGHKWADRRIPDELTARLADEPLIVDTDGAVLETARSNLFVVADDGIHTPPLDGRILPGVTRAAVLEHVRGRGIPTYERVLRIDDLAEAEEVFVTNAIRGVVPVTACVGVGGWPVGATTEWLRDTLDGPSAAAPPSTTPPDARVLLVDNYDSFSYNLAQYAEEFGASVEVVRNDARSAGELAAACRIGTFTHVVISPGPGRPSDAGLSVELVRLAAGTVPILGVCLGHQAIAAAFGARVVRARTPVHGKPSIVHHDGRGIFAGMEGPAVAARYHSLVIDELPSVLEVTARTADGTIMGIRHRDLVVEGVQVHPESILTRHGHRMVANFLSM